MSEHQNDESGAAEPGPNWVMRGPQEEAEAAETPPETPPPRRPDETTRARRRTAPFLLLLLVAIVAIGVSAPFWGPPLLSLLRSAAPAHENTLAQQLQGLDRRLSELAQQQTALAQRLDRIEEAQHAAAAAGTEQQQQAAQLKELGDRVAALEQQRNQPSPADTAQLSTLGQQVAALDQKLQQLATAQGQANDRVAKLEARDTMPAAQRTDQALLLALGPLRQQVDSGAPYDGALQSIEGLGHDRPEIHNGLAPLEPTAKQGLPSEQALARRFEEEVVPGVMRADAAAPESGGWGQRILAKLRALVVVRRVGDNAVAHGDPLEATLARAEAALGRHDLAGAVQAIEQLPERDAAPAQGWLAAARRRLAAEQALASLADALSERLTADSAR